MSVGSRQKARLFIEGREVPFQAATITATVGAPISATISLVPLREIKFIKPRTQVHIFMQDTKNFPDDDFYLMFEGEVLGRAMSKRQDSRSFSVVALDYSSYWDECKAYVMNPNFAIGKVADVVALQDGTIDSRLKELSGVCFTTSATSNTRVVEIMLAGGNQDLAQGVVSVVKTLATANQFYTAAYERLVVNQRINLFSSQNLGSFLKDMQMKEFLQSFTGTFGGVSTLRDMLYSVMALVFHDFISVPFPAYIKPSTIVSGKVTNPASQALSKTEYTSSAGRALSSFLFVPDCYSLPAPMCNVVFPNQQSGYNFTEDFRALPTRYSFRASMPLMTDSGVQFPQYPTQFYPTAFSDYMFRKRTATSTELASSLGPSTLLTDPKSGNTYASIFYGNSKKTGVGTTFGTILREADYMSNEESLKGIYLEMDTFMPGYTALIKRASVASRTAFIQGVGSYLFYKKRFSSRQVSAELIFHPYLVPGFNALFLDDSEAGQSFVAKLQTVSHTITHEGSTTNVSLAYGRDFDEVDELTGGTGEPPTPPWFDTNIFGQVDTDSTLFDAETEYLQNMGAIDQDEADARNEIVNPVVFPNLSLFFQSLLGVDSTTNYVKTTSAASQAAADALVAGGAKATTSNTPAPKSQIVSTRGAVSYLLYQYGQVSDDVVARDQKVRMLNYRPLVPLIAAFDYIRAQPVGFDDTGRFVLPDEFAAFTANQSTGIDLPGRFDGVNLNTGNIYADVNAIKQRRDIINQYVLKLKTQVGFRG